MTEVEIAEILESVNMYELACKTNAKMPLTESETVAVAELDKRFKAIGEAGHDTDNEIAQFIRRTINEELYNYPNDLLDAMFDRDTIGEFDDYDALIMPAKNTLVAYDAAKGGNVDRSFLDITRITPKFFNKQIETDIKFSEVKRGGWKSIATLTQYAMDTFSNAMFKEIFDMVDDGIKLGAENYISEATAMPTQATMDELALYMMEHAEGGAKTVVGLTKYIQGVSKLPAYLAVESTIQEVRNNGLLGYYDSCSLYPINSTHRVGGTELLIPDKRLYGVAGKIGTIDMRGSVNVYQHEDTNKEQFHLKFADFAFGVCLNKDTLEKVCKVVMAQ